MITAGDLGSPLHRIVREDSRLAYSPGLISSVGPDGGYWGLEAQTNIANPQEVIDGFWQVLRSPDVRSVDWFEFVQDTIRGEFDMHDPSPGDFTEEAAGRLTGYGEVWSDQELRRRLLSVSQETVVEFLDALSPENGHALIFQGTRS
jgi:predicted Zn-dependent peptidase